MATVKGNLFKTTAFVECSHVIDITFGINDIKRKVLRAWPGTFLFMRDFHAGTSKHGFEKILFAAEGAVADKSNITASLR